MNKSSVPLSRFIERIQLFAPEQGGVFSFSDLWNIIGLSSSDRTAKVVHRLVRDGTLFKIRRGIYVTRNPDLWVLASRLKKTATISMDSVLAQSGLIGTKPERSVSVVTPGNTRTLKTPFGDLRYFKIKKSLIFGTIKSHNGVQIADNEKAILDLLYYYNKGASFVIDPLRDVDLRKLNVTKLKGYLRAYRNPKFRKFVEGLFNGQD